MGVTGFKTVSEVEAALATPEQRRQAVAARMVKQLRELTGDAPQEQEVAEEEVGTDLVLNLISEVIGDESLTADERLERIREILADAVEAQVDLPAELQESAEAAFNARLARRLNSQRGRRELSRHRTLLEQRTRYPATREAFADALAGRGEAHLPFAELEEAELLEEQSQSVLAQAAMEARDARRRQKQAEWQLWRDGERKMYQHYPSTHEEFRKRAGIF